VALTGVARFPLKHLEGDAARHSFLKLLFWSDLDNHMKMAQSLQHFCMIHAVNLGDFPKICCNGYEEVQNSDHQFKDKNKSVQYMQQITRFVVSQRCQEYAMCVDLL
jgi:hypothetical protein